LDSITLGWLAQFDLVKRLAEGGIPKSGKAELVKSVRRVASDRSGGAGVEPAKASDVRLELRLA
jgi:hypothetical protein